MNNLDEDMEKLDGFFNKGWNCDLDEIHSIVANIAKELETYKKIAEKLAHYIWQYDCCEYEIGKNGKCEGYYIDKDCTEKCIIDWARKEVEKDE